MAAEIGGVDRPVCANSSHSTKIQGFETMIRQKPSLQAVIGIAQWAAPTRVSSPQTPIPPSQPKRASEHDILPTAKRPIQHKPSPSVWPLACVRRPSSEALAGKAGMEKCAGPSPRRAWNDFAAPASTAAQAGHRPRLGLIPKSGCSWPLGTCNKRSLEEAQDGRN